MKAVSKNTWSTGSAATSNVFRASSGLLNAMRQVIAPLDGVQEVRVLHRTADVSKFFVIMTSASLETIDRVVGAMVQMEEMFDSFDYDTIPAERAPLVPPDAVAVGHD